MKIKVTKRHILKGKKQDNEKCPIALAIKDLRFDLVSVGSSCLFIEYEEYFLPKKARNFIVSFDHEEYVKPFEFLLRKVYA